MTEPISGRCACGAITYSSSATPEFTLLCHCRPCQRISGSGHTAQLALPASATTISGVITFYEIKTPSGNTVHSGFCGSCGSPMLLKRSRVPGTLFIHAATLDEPASYAPQMVMHHEARQPWDQVDATIPRKNEF